MSRASVNQLGESVPHDSSHLHVTGKSIFVDDRPRAMNEVLVFVKGAPVACGELIGIDATKALEIPGVLAVYTATDFSHNLWGTIVPEQPLLVSKKIGYRDEPVCLVVATTAEAGQRGLESLRIEVREESALLDLDEAIRQKKFLYQSTPFVVGDPDKSYSEAEHKLEGYFECGGQEHFYLESQASVVVPLEDGFFEVHSSSQHPTETQHVVAEALGISQQKVICIVKRMGGAFGGKESQAAPFAAMAALVAQKLRRPARLVLSKDDDMRMTGKRHPFKNFYQVGFDSSGMIQSLKVQIFANAGAYVDLSPSILDRACFHVDGAYFLPSARIEGFACRTNQHSNTAFRGFGGPQGNMTIECIIEEIAQVLGMDALDVRQRNCYGVTPRNVTPYGQEIQDSVLSELFRSVELESNYRQRQNEISIHNAENTGTLRGLSVTAVKFGISFTARHLNQASALVHLHRDGSLQVSTGATEMGQGVNTKIAQTVSSVLGVPVSKIAVMATQTDKNANTSPTAASSGAELNCAAADLAANEIKRRLAWVAEQMLNQQSQLAKPSFEISLPQASWKSSGYRFEQQRVYQIDSQKSLSFVDVVACVYLHRISLSELAHYKTPGLGFDKKTSQGRPFHYFTNGVAASEVEVDEFTGQVKVRRVDLLMDLGCSMNPQIDLGQVTGAFVQGMGWVTTENLYYDSGGRLLSHSPTTYKIPSVQDTPREFNVRLIENSRNQQNIFATKAVGEPPLLLSASVWTAVKKALAFKFGRIVVPFSSPATPEVVLKALAQVKEKKTLR